MSTRPLGPPPLLTDDPGPWSVVSSVFAQAGRPGRRRPQPPMGLMLSPPPDRVRPTPGLDPSLGAAGAGPVRVVAAAREPALHLSVDPGGDLLRGVSPHVLRAWSLPDLVQQIEERPGDDPAAALPPAVHPGALGEPELPGAVESPGGGLLAVHTREGRSDVIALLRASDRALVRWIRGARAAAWTPDGQLLAIGGPWGVILARASAEPSE